MTTPVATPPHIVLLTTALNAMRAVDYPGACGAQLWSVIADLHDGKPIKVRHARNRPPPGADKPTVTLVWTGNADGDGSYLSADERAKEMNFELIYDMALPEEDSELDPTGWLIISTINAAAFSGLRAATQPETAQSVTLDWATDGDLTPDEDASGPDNGRLVQAGTVLYRVSTNDPNVLLAPGV